MKPDIHPKYGELIIVMNNGEEFITNSTKSGRLVLDVDFRSHPAWTGSVSEINKRAGKFQKFNNKFGFMTMTETAKEPEAPTEA